MWRITKCPTSLGVKVSHPCTSQARSRGRVRDRRNPNSERSEPWLRPTRSKQREQRAVAATYEIQIHLNLISLIRALQTWSQYEPHMPRHFVQNVKLQYACDILVHYVMDGSQESRSFRRQPKTKAICSPPTSGRLTENEMVPKQRPTYFYYGYHPSAPLAGRNIFSVTYRGDGSDGQSRPSQATVAEASRPVEEYYRAVVRTKLSIENSHNNYILRNNNTVREDFVIGNY